MITRFEHFTYCVNEISFLWHRIASSEMKKYGIKGSSALLFIQLYHHPEGMTAAQLTESCGIDKADISREIKAFEKAGLISRTTDGRRSYRTPIILTSKGQEMAADITGKAEKASRIIAASMTEEESRIFNASLDKITESLKNLSQMELDSFQ